MTDFSDLRDGLMADRIRVAKAQLWEEGKGKLRAMVAVEGQCGSHNRAHHEQRRRWREAQDRIEEFIRRFEDDALHE
ncbi:hypothetical protein [uncultured Novosphingobium sp.]|mgnify:CR=1 FL=1|uniref:hypothetical protein n=1 Tax=uncultured Novosphingobium sp. TaxID=292277 RepID=UPI002599E3BE|nr:hypothetical protein [uncultured Novosphingobium sp.]